MSNGNFWIGTTHGTVFRGNNLISAGYSSRGQFWFRADGEGQLEGHALVVYEPTFDPAGLNAALGHIKTAGTAALGAIPIVGAALGTVGGALADAIAVRGSYDEPMTAIEGSITGTLTESSLTISWADDSERALPITVFLDGVGTSQEITSSSALATGSPWVENATVTAIGDTRQAVSVHQDSSTSEGATFSTSNAWSAVQG